MAEIIRNRTIRPSSRLETSKSYKIDTKAVLIDDTLIVNINHESKSFEKSFRFKGSDVVDKNSISFRVSESGNNIDISWSNVEPSDTTIITSVRELTNTVKQKKTITSNNRDEHYVLDLCDKVLELKSSRQHKFDFLLGDLNAKGAAVKLPVDAYYEELQFVIEYREKQHSENVSFFDKPNKMTISGVNRGEQRKIYDQRRRDELPKKGIKLIEISYSDFNYDKQKKIIRDEKKDLEIINEIIKKLSIT